jgi:large subunit ribosomal protein L23
MAQLQYYDILFEPITSEKSMKLVESKTYSFYVHPDATKNQVAEAVERLFDGAVVKKVNTFNLKGKPIRRGIVKGKRSKRKKAVVFLEESSAPLQIM